MARVVSAADRAALEERTRRGFAQRFGREPSLCVSAPGRANLIGEHTDYNDGFVLPFALARRTAVAARPRRDRRVTFESALVPGRVEMELDAAGERSGPVWSGHERSDPRWGNYVRGVVAECLVLASDEGPLDFPGFDAWIDSDVPVGAGLSSSAALEVATAGIVESLAGRGIDPVAKAALCRRAEKRFAGVPCGVMDQMASVLAAEGTLLFLDCRDLEWRRIALPASEVEILIVDSELPHDLGQGEFARRVEECASAARLLGVPSLREASGEDLERLAGDPVLYRRALHVIEENARVVAAVEAIRTNDWEGLGALLDASHASLRDLYEVSRPEMDALVMRLRRSGALGARMTGGGFGGCAVALVRAGESRVCSAAVSGG